MFNEQERTAYQSIRAPQELYEKVMTAKKPARHWARYAPVVAAACLALVVTAGFLFRRNDPVILVQGEPLVSSVEYYDISPASEMRSSPTVTVPLELELPKADLVSVTVGKLYVNGVAAGNELMVSDKVQVSWEVPRDTDYGHCDMIIGTGKDATVLTLEIEESKITLTKKGD